MQPFHWTCPFCNRDTTITDANYLAIATYGTTDSIPDYVWMQGISIFCPNNECEKSTFSVRLGRKNTSETPPVVKESWALIPESNAKPFPDYIPEALLKDYQEACVIMNKSAKASATLARRCLQGIIRNFHGIVKPTLKEEVDALKGNIPSDDWEAIDAIRSVGNIGAHMERDVNVIIDVEPEEAYLAD